MKLQKFIQNYHRKNFETPNSHSPQRPYIFRTSESIGTLNSNDEFTTQRSFVVKDHSYNTSPNTQSIEHLRQLCQSERQSFVKSNGDQSQKAMERNISEQQSERGQLQSTACVNFTKQHSKDQSFIKNKSTRVVQTLDGEISFSVSPENQDFFYEQAPSELYEGCPTEQPQALRREEAEFLDHYNELLARVNCLQAENAVLEQQVKKSKDIKSFLLEKQQTLQTSMQQLKQEVSEVIRQNIEIENKIKQMLLRHQMQKYRFFSSDKDGNVPLIHCNSEQQFSLRSQCPKQKS